MDYVYIVLYPSFFLFAIHPIYPQIQTISSMHCALTNTVLPRLLPVGQFYFPRPCDEQTLLQTMKEEDDFSKVKETLTAKALMNLRNPLLSAIKVSLSDFNFVVRLRKIDICGVFLQIVELSESLTYCISF